jgi:hypothetical protein
VGPLQRGAIFKPHLQAVLAYLDELGMYAPVGIALQYPDNAGGWLSTVAPFGRIAVVNSALA